jgi:hypothetical protein
MMLDMDGQRGNGQAAAHGGYLYDVFLSYSFKPDIQHWVNTKFYPNFVNPLDEELIQLGMIAPPPNGRMCLAKRELRAGDPWPDELKNQLQHSKVMIAVCSPSYFASGWCKSEWETFRVRAPKLIIPVLYSGADDFLLPRIQPIQGDDFREFRNIPGGAMARFRNRLATLANAVAAKVNQAPSFSGNFPSVVMPAVPTPNTQFLSL